MLSIIRMDLTSSENKITDPNYVAFFDLDRTIAREISGKAIVKLAWDKDLIGISDIINALRLFVLFRLGFRNPLSTIHEMVRWVKGKSEKLLNELCLEVSVKTLLPSIYKEAIAAISSHKSANARVVILSSSLSGICEHVSEYLGMDGSICSSLAVKDGYMTGEPAGRLCFGDEKLVRLREYCIKNTMTLSESWYYSDSYSDMPVLQSVGNPVCVNPDRRLRKVALKRGWTIVSWKN